MHVRGPLAAVGTQQRRRISPAGERARGPLLLPTFVGCWRLPCLSILRPYINTNMERKRGPKKLREKNEEKETQTTSKYPQPTNKKQQQGAVMTLLQTTFISHGVT